MEAPARISAHRTTRRWTTSIAVAIGLPLSLVLGASTPAHADSIFPDQQLASGQYRIWDTADNGERRWLGVSGDQVIFAKTGSPMIWAVSPNMEWLSQIRATSGKPGCIQRDSKKKSNKLKLCLTGGPAQFWHISCYSETSCDVVNYKTDHHLTVGGRRDSTTHFEWINPNIYGYR